MTGAPWIRPPAGWPTPVASLTEEQTELYLPDLQTLRAIVEGLDALEARLDSSPVPKAVTERGYFTPDEDDRVRQGVLSYRNYRLAAYEIIFRNRAYAAVEPQPGGYRRFLLAFGAALVLYAKSLKIISVAEHVPMLRAKINEPDMKFGMEEGFFDDVLACYSQPANYRSRRQADAYWRAHRRKIQAFIREAGEDWVWLAALIRRQRRVVRIRLLHVLLQRLRHDWRAFTRTVLWPLRQARQGLEQVVGDRLADVRVTDQPTCALCPELLQALRSKLEPGDVLLMRNDSRLTAALLPGFWTHAALFMGSRAHLEKLGLRSHSHVARHWEKIPEDPGPLGCVIEAMFPCVQLNPLEKCLQVDHVVVLRSRLSELEVANALGEALGQLGKPYDFDFDFNNTSRIVCTEVVYRSFHGRGRISFALTKRLGRFTLSGDDIVAQALDAPGDAHGEPALMPVALVLKLRDGKAHLADQDRILPWLRRVRRGWRPARKVAEIGVGAGSNS
jgi:hypothetical protein